MPPLYRRPISGFLAGLVCLTLPHLTSAQALAAESFQSTSSANFRLGGSASLTAANGTDANGQGYLRLTDSGQNQAGFAISNQQFPATQGFSISFELFAYGGTGGDGFSIFLVDADRVSAAGFVPGATGGSLGYAQKNTYPVGPGVPFGYFGVGFDEFGNYSQATEGRSGGRGYTPNAVAIRGAGNGSGATDYPYLSGSASLSFPLAVATTRAQEGSDDYRRAYVTVVPVNGSYEITVRLQHGSALETVVDRYVVAAPPQNLRIGFAGSTGARTNYHELRKLFVARAPFLADQKVTLAAGGTATLDGLQGAAFTYAPYQSGTFDLNISQPGIQNTLTYSAGTFRVDAAGVISFTSVPGFVGSFTAPVTAIDQLGQPSAPANVTFVVQAAPLPVTLTDFTAQTAGPDARLTWVTATETTNAGFTVERGLTGASFTPVGFLASQGTGGGHYAFLDREAAAQTPTGTWYYRLRQTDTNGKVNYSPVKVVTFSGRENLFGLYPNPVPAGQPFDVAGLAAGTETEVRVLTLTGQLLYETRLPGGQGRVSPVGLPAGSYLVSTRSGNQPPQTRLLHQE